MGRRRAVSLDFPLPPPRPPPHSRHKRHRRCRRFLERNMVTISLLICASECFLMLLWLLRVVGCCMSFSCCCSILPLFPQCAACWCAFGVCLYFFISLFFLLLPLFVACCWPAISICTLGALRCRAKKEKKPISPNLVSCPTMATEDRPSAGIARNGLILHPEHPCGAK
jgi:hypothetical protein